MSNAPTPSGLSVATIGRGLVALLPALALLALVLFTFRDTAVAMVSIWIRSETFTHAFLVPPIVLWLVWRRRAELALLPRQPQPVLLLPITAVCAAWLLAELASVNAATQFALVSLIVLCVPALFGWAITRRLAFPLLFLYFAVPFGDFMVEPMMDLTADFTVVALQLTGVPVFREGLQFVIPSGHWSVIEACSGVRYLIASFMVGTLFAYLNYRSTKRRVLFVLVSLLVPIVANWVRAYAIVMVAHLTSNQIAAGADHLIYGWVFFGFVIFLMFVIGARWSEPEAPAVAPTASGAVLGEASIAPRQAIVIVGIIGLMFATHGAIWKLEQSSRGGAPRLDLPAASAAWTQDGTPLSDWTPHYLNASAVARTQYRGGDAGAPVGLWVGYYRDQGFDRKMVSSTNAFVEPVPVRWTQVSRGQGEVPGVGVPLRTAVLRASASVDSGAAPRLLAAQVWWVGGTFTTSEYRAKVQLALNRLLGRGDDAAVLILYTSIEGDSDVPAAQARLGGFAAARWPDLTRMLEAARSSP